MKKDINEFIKRLKKGYGNATTSLDHKTPLQLLVATILSAQCTDERVNKVTPALFKRYKTPADFASADPAELEGLIHSTGFYKSKAKSIIEACRAIAERHGGKVPKTMDELLELRGVARKTANVVLGSAYGIAAGVVVDTHVKRLAFRMGFTKNRTPEKIETDLMKLIPQDEWIWFSHALVDHGRKICKAINPDCQNCLLSDICPKKELKK